MFTAQVTSSWDSTVDGEDKLRYETPRNRSSIRQRGKTSMAGPQVHTASHYEYWKIASRGWSDRGAKLPFTST